MRWVALKSTNERISIPTDEQLRAIATSKPDKDQGLVGCIIGFEKKPENPNQKPKPVRTYLDHFQITLKADFRYATLLKPN